MLLVFNVRKNCLCCNSRDGEQCFPVHISFFALFYTKIVLFSPFFQGKNVLFILFLFQKISFFPLLKARNRRGTPVCYASRDLLHTDITG